MRAGWRILGTTGYKFKGSSRDGLTNALVRGGDAGKSNASVKGKGLKLPDPTLPLGPRDRPIAEERVVALFGEHLHQRQRSDERWNKVQSEKVAAIRLELQDPEAVADHLAEAGAGVDA